MTLDDERAIASLSLFLFALPAFVPAATRFVAVPSYVLTILPLLPIVALVVYWRKTASSGNSPRTTGTNQSELLNRTVGDAVEDLALVSANYQMLNRQAMYRDRLLMRAKYFSLAIYGTLAILFTRSPDEFAPLVVMVGAATAYGFLLWTMSYKSTRDNINQGLREIEELYPDLFTITTVDTRYRGPVAKRSLSSYTIALQVVATVTLLLVYFTTLLRFAYF